MSTPYLPSELSGIHYLPVLTTLICLTFALILARRYLRRGGTHHLWWACGVAAYGLGTALEASITLLGNSPMLTKSWYVAGALLGGYPLAQGSVYFHFKRRTAHVLTLVTVPFIVLFSVLVMLSPVRAAALESFRPSGSVLEWQWIRLFTPLINLYAVVFLIGTAALSAWHFAFSAGDRNRAVGNALIAAGALLPGIGGSLAKAGIVEALYVGEFVGIVLIWVGYTFCVRVAIPRPVQRTDNAHQTAG